MAIFDSSTDFGSFGDDWKGVVTECQMPEPDGIAVVTECQRVSLFNLSKEFTC